MSARFGLAPVVLVLLAGCAAVPPSFARAPGTGQPLTLPAADGRAADVGIGDGFRYIVNRQALDQALGKVFLRVTRAGAPEMTYSDGLLAKRVAEAYCAEFNRELNPVAYGKFSTPASWLFEGGCT